MNTKTGVVHVQVTAEDAFAWRRFRKTAIVEAVQLPFAFVVETLEGTHHGNPGDWLMRGVEGELYPCKESVFEKTYEEVEQEREQGNAGAAWLWRSEVNRTAFEMVLAVGALEMETKGCNNCGHLMWPVTDAKPYWYCVWCGQREQVLSEEDIMSDKKRRITMEKVTNDNNLVETNEPEVKSLAYFLGCLACEIWMLEEIVYGPRENVKPEGDQTLVLMDKLHYRMKVTEQLTLRVGCVNATLRELKQYVG